MIHEAPAFPHETPFVVPKVVSPFSIAFWMVLSVPLDEMLVVVLPKQIAPVIRMPFEFEVGKDTPTPLFRQDRIVDIVAPHKAVNANPLEALLCAVKLL